MSPEYVLDSFSLIAMLNHEPGAARARAILEQADAESIRCRASAINIGELVYIIERRSGELRARPFLATVRETPLYVVDATWERILAAAHIKSQFPISYADAFAVALAQEFGSTLLTGDPEF